MAENSKKPRIRFKGFTEAWEQRKLSELGKIETGNTPPTSTSENYSESGLPWITPTDIISNITTKTERTLSLKGMQIARVIPANSILCTCIASIGKNTFSPVKCAFNQQINALSPNNNQDPYFIFTDSYHWSQTMKKGAGGLTFQIVNKTEFSNIQTNIPKKTEQAKIGNLFYNLDNLITLHQRKYDKLLNVKKALLEKMFPKNGKNTPEIRFKGFTEAWEQCKLGKTNTYFTDGNYGESYPKPKDMTDKSCGIPFLTGGNLKNGKLDLSGANYITIEKHNELLSGHLFEDDIVIAVRGSLGALGYVNKENSGWNINSQLAIFRTDKNILLGKYLLQFLISDRGQVELLKRQTGSALKQLPIGAIKDINIPLTNIKEQKQIGNIFNNLDNLITLHQRKYEKLKNVKKSLLEKMFV